MSNVAIVVVFFHPTNRQIKQFLELSRTYTVIAVDNSEFSNGVFHGENFIYLPQFKNRGIACAQNIGIKKLKEIGVRYVIFFDQDSEIGVEFIENLYAEYIKVSENDLYIGAIGPTIINKKNLEPYKMKIEPCKSADYYKVTSLISSGTLTNMEVIYKVGLMENDLFIDYVDFEWCWRLLDKGYHLYVSSNVRLLHSVGDNDSRFLGFPIIISSPFRYYYKNRNAILLFNRNYVPSVWKWKTLARLLFSYIHMLYSSCYKGKRWSYISNSISGFFDGLKCIVRGK